MYIIICIFQIIICYFNLNHLVVCFFPYQTYSDTDELDCIDNSVQYVIETLSATKM